MKRYFAKYLIVGGKIEIGDKYRDGSIVLTRSGSNSSDYEHLEKSKLFLCSRDINWMDIVKHGEYLTDCHVGDDIPLDFAKSINCFKIIGEISPDATYTEGQELTEEEVKNILLVE